MYVSCLSWKCCIFIGFLILRKPHRWKKFVWLRTKIFSTNQIAVFFDHQYFCMESSNLLDILHGDSFIKDRWVPRLDLLVGSNHLCLSFNQIVGFCDYQYLWKESSVFFLHGVIHQGHLGLLLLVGWSQLSLSSSEVEDSLIINIFAKSQVISYFLHEDIRQDKVAPGTTIFGRYV